MSNGSIYLVWNPLGDNPSRRHGSLAEAREEAERLARAVSDMEFFVLRAVESVQHLSTPILRKSYSKKG